MEVRTKAFIRISTGIHVFCVTWSWVEILTSLGLAPDICVLSQISCEYGVLARSWFGPKREKRLLSQWGKKRQSSHHATRHIYTEHCLTHSKDPLLHPFLHSLCFDIIIFDQSLHHPSTLMLSLCKSESRLLIELPTHKWWNTLSAGSRKTNTLLVVKSTNMAVSRLRHCLLI